jgi:hypothetical protein
VHNGLRDLAAGNSAAVEWDTDVEAYRDRRITEMIAAIFAALDG